MCVCVCVCVYTGLIDDRYNVAIKTNRSVLMALFVHFATFENKIIFFAVSITSLGCSVVFVYYFFPTRKQRRKFTFLLIEKNKRKAA